METAPFAFRQKSEQQRQEFRVSLPSPASRRGTTHLKCSLTSTRTLPLPFSKSRRVKIASFCSVGGRLDALQCIILIINVCSLYSHALLFAASAPLVLHFQRGFEAQLSLTKRCVVDKRTFATQFRDFTSGIFEGMSPDLWANVIVAGGAVLGACLPLDRNWKTIPVVSIPGRSHAPLHDFSLVNGSSGYSSMDDSMTRTPAQFLSTVRWPGSDIDVFIYGISDPVVADKKARALLAHFKGAMSTRSGCGTAVNPVAFVRTLNTVTINGGKSFRNVQIITRLYKDQSDILNSFDIDCCCVGFDGTCLRMTPRAQRAITLKANIVNLDIRGNAYEYRLTKCE